MHHKFDLNGIQTHDSAFHVTEMFAVTTQPLVATLSNPTLIKYIIVKRHTLRQFTFMSLMGKTPHGLMATGPSPRPPGDNL